MLILWASHHRLPKEVALDLRASRMRGWQGQGQKGTWEPVDIRVSGYYS